jgi:fucose permease
MVEALEVRHNAKVGLTLGLLTALAVYGFFVVLPRATVRSQLYYVGLAFVLALTVGALATTVLVARTAVRLSREP